MKLSLASTINCFPCQRKNAWRNALWCLYIVMELLQWHFCDSLMLHFFLKTATASFQIQNLLLQKPLLPSSTWLSFYWCCDNIPHHSLRHNAAISTYKTKTTDKNASQFIYVFTLRKLKRGRRVIWCVR